jgi:hypothetical protein
MSVADEPPLRDFLDRAIRDSLRYPEHLQALLQEAVPNLAAGFDCQRARLLDREFPLDDWRRREADLPFEIPYRFGVEEIWALVCVLIEHQSDTDPMMPLRLLYFAVVYWDKQWHEWEKLRPPRPEFRLRPVLPIVLYTSDRPWGSNRSIADLLGEPDALRAFAPKWEPLFWNLSEQAPETLLQSGTEWLQTLAVVRAQNAESPEFEKVFLDALQRLQALHDRDQVRWYDLLRIVLTLAFWRRPKKEVAQLLAAAQTHETDMARRKEIEMWSSKYGPTIADEAWEKGKAEGKAEGLAEGLREGLLRGRREDLRTLLEEQFGPLPEALIQRIDALDDPERLRIAIRNVPQMEKLDDLQL